MGVRLSLNIYEVCCSTLFSHSGGSSLPIRELRQQKNTNEVIGWQRLKMPIEHPFSSGTFQNWKETLLAHFLYWFYHLTWVYPCGTQSQYTPNCRRSTSLLRQTNKFPICKTANRMLPITMESIPESTLFNIGSNASHACCIACCSSISDADVELLQTKQQESMSPPRTATIAWHRRAPWTLEPNVVLSILWFFVYWVLAEFD